MRIVDGVHEWNNHELNPAPNVSRARPWVRNTLPKTRASCHRVLFLSYGKRLTEFSTKIFTFELLQDTMGYWLVKLEGQGSLLCDAPHAEKGTPHTFMSVTEMYILKPVFTPDKNTKTPLSVDHPACPWKHDVWQLLQFWTTFIFDKKTPIFSFHPHFFLLLLLSWYFLIFYAHCHFENFSQFLVNFFSTPPKIPPPQHFKTFLVFLNVSSTSPCRLYTQLWVTTVKTPFEPFTPWFHGRLLDGWLRVWEKQCAPQNCKAF